MKRKMLLLCVSVSLAVVGLWLLTSGLARAADQHLGLRPTDNPLGVPGAVLTPTLRLVGPDGETLLSSPVFRVHGSEPLSRSLYVRNPLTRAVSMVAERVEISSADGAFVPGMLGLSPVSQTVAADKVGTFTLSLIEGWLPAGTYSGTLELSAEGTQPATEQFILLVSPWDAQLEWAQEEFVYVADEAHTEAIVRFVARLGDAKDIRAQLPTLTAKDAVTMPFKTMDFLSITVPPTLARDTVTELALNFTAARLPMPETYNGELQLIASNAAPITAPFTLVVPDRARGSYQLVVTELGQSPPITAPALLTLTTALQFTGVRWLPASTSATSWWPIVAGALLVGVGLAVLTGYTVWGLAGPAPKAEVKGWWQKVRKWLQEVWALATGHPKVILGLMAGTLVLVVLVVSLLLDLTQAHVGDRNLLIWEVEGRGPVREVTVFGGEVVNQIGDWGRIRIGDHDGEIAAQDVLTVPVTGIQGVSQPGVYQGHILIQSPDITGGLVKVPVQVTVHDFIFWPALVILLGVVAGGWVKYLQGIASQRLEKQRDIERVWQKWDDYMLRDRYKYTSKEEDDKDLIINPIYADVRQDLDYARRLLNLEGEWGAEDAGHILTEVEQRLTKYQNLSEAVAYWSDELPEGKAYPETKQFVEWIVEVENLLRSGVLDSATVLMNSRRRAALLLRKRGLGKLVIGIPDDGDEEKKAAKEAIQDLLKKAEEEKSYGEAWSHLNEAEDKIRAQGIQVPCLATLFAVKERATVTPSLPPERYEIRLPSPPVRYCAQETIPLSVVYRGKKAPEVTEVQWRATHLVSKQEEGPERVGLSGKDVLFKFPKDGDWTVTVDMEPDDSQQRPRPLTLHIKPSVMEVIYRDKRRHNFNRRLAAGLMALVGGMAAKRVFGITFGSFEEYLGAFGWGVGVSAGIDPVAGGYETLKQKVQELLKLGSTT